MVQTVYNVEHPVLFNSTGQRSKHSMQSTHRRASLSGSFGKGRPSKKLQESWGIVVRFNCRSFVQNPFKRWNDSWTVRAKTWVGLRDQTTQVKAKTLKKTILLQPLADGKQPLGSWCWIAHWPVCLLNIHASRSNQQNMPFIWHIALWYHIVLYNMSADTLIIHCFQCSAVSSPRYGLEGVYLHRNEQVGKGCICCSGCCPFVSTPEATINQSHQKSIVVSFLSVVQQGFFSC